MSKALTVWLVALHEYGPKDADWDARDTGLTNEEIAERARRFVAAADVAAGLVAPPPPRPTGTEPGSGSAGSTRNLDTITIAGAYVAAVAVTVMLVRELRMIRASGR